MDIEQAKELRVGDWVFCPADRGGKPYRGQIYHTGGAVHTNLNNEEFMWVSVVNPSTGKKSVWPTNRLG